MGYEELLKRAKEKLPKGILEKSRFEPPEPVSFTQGNKTILTNFSHIANYLNREQANFLKFLLRELATSGNIEGPKAVFVGRFSNKQISEKIRKYINEFVVCPECKKPDTKLLREDRISFLKCMACGAKRPVRTIK